MLSRRSVMQTLRNLNYKNCKTYQAFFQIKFSFILTLAVHFNIRYSLFDIHYSILYYLSISGIIISNMAMIATRSPIFPPVAICFKAERCEKFGERNFMRYGFDVPSPTK